MDWKALIANVAPWIGTALGGPLGGAAMGALSNALGLNDSTEATIKQALSGVTPEQLLAVKNADQAFALKMQELNINSVKDLEQIAASDRDSARKREETVKDDVPKILAYGVTIGFFSTLGFTLFHGVPKDDGGIMMMMIGALQATWTGVISYYFGTTASSLKKTDALVQVSGNAQSTDGSK